jgi:hypothetical protein
MRINLIKMELILLLLTIIYLTNSKFINLNNYPRKLIELDLQTQGIYK